LEDLPVELLVFTDSDGWCERRAWVGARLKEIATEASMNARLPLGHFSHGRMIADTVRHMTGNQSTVEEFTFDKIQHKSAEMHDFTLSYYGLPETSPDESSRILPHWVVATNIALFCAVIVLIVLRRKLKQKMQA
jgi:hypothetical protein